MTGPLPHLIPALGAGRRGPVDRLSRNFTLREALLIGFPAISLSLFFSNPAAWACRWAFPLFLSFSLSVFLLSLLLFHSSLVMCWLRRWRGRGPGTRAVEETRLGKGRLRKPIVLMYAICPGCLMPPSTLSVTTIFASRLADVAITRTLKMCSTGSM